MLPAQAAGRAWREHKGDDPGDTYCLDVPPGPPCFCQPNTYQLNPSLENLDFARALGRMDCGNSSAKFCDPVNVQPLLDPARSARLDDTPGRQELMEQLVDIAYDEAIIYTYFDALVFYGSSANLDWRPASTAGCVPITGPSTRRRSTLPTDTEKAPPLFRGGAFLCAGAVKDYPTHLSGDH